MIICPYIPNSSIKQEYIKKVHETETAQIQAAKANEDALWLQEYCKFLINNPPKS